VVSASLSPFDCRPSRILDDIRHDAAASVIDRAWPLSTLRRQRSSDKHLDEDLESLNRAGLGGGRRAFPGDELVVGSKHSEKNVSGE